jgi:D-amino peptidase
MKGIKRVFISVDMEGISTIVDWSEVDNKHSEYSITRKIMAGDLNVAIEAAVESGVKEIIVSDAHGGMRNLRPMEVHEAACLVRGSPKPFGMMEGIDREFDAAMYIGHHSMKGTQNGIMCHTISGRVIDGIWINNVETGEFGLNSALAGYFGVPSIFLSGDLSATKEAISFIPGISTATVKWALGRYSAKCLHPDEAHKLIRVKVKEALAKKAPELYSVKEPVEVMIKFGTSTMCDIVSLMPSFERFGGRVMKGSFDDYKTAFNALRASIYLAGGIEGR